MRTLLEAELLELWESGLHRHPLDAALLALASVFPEASHDNLAGWPLGRRNRALAELYRHCFGPLLRAWTACEHCGEKLEFDIEAESLIGGDFGNDTPEPVIANGRTFRLPTSRDLAMAAREADPEAGALRIAENCLLEPDAPADWSGAELAEIGEKMALADPLAEIRLNLHCPGCGTDALETIDLVSFVWSEIDARVRHLLFDVHTLASAYGWSESDILTMGENRRAIYLELAQA